MDPLSLTLMTPAWLVSVARENHLEKNPNLKLVERVMFTHVYSFFTVHVNFAVGWTLIHTFTTMNIISNILSSILDIEFRVLRRVFQNLELGIQAFNHKVLFIF